MNGEKPKTRVLREINERQEILLRVLETVKYASVENITVKDKQIRTFEVRLRFDLDRPEEFKRTLDELKTIALIE